MTHCPALQKQELKEKLISATEENKKIKDEIKKIKLEIKEIKNKQKENSDSVSRNVDEVESQEKNLNELNDQLKELKSVVKLRVSLKDVAWEESARILDKVGIADARKLLDRFPHELSGGMNQRIMI